MSFVDLHVHTTASDGTLSPTEVVKYGVEKNLSVIAITDHDTISGIEEGMKAAENEPITVVPGIELACMYQKREIHMLGFFVDWKDEIFVKRLADLRQNREKRNEKMIEKMQRDGIPVTMEKLRFEEEDTVITRAHFARFLEQEGYVKSKNEAFEKYVGIHCPYYIPREYIDPKEAISWIHQAKGMAFLAHPYLYHFSEYQVKTMIKDLKEMGLDGIEAYHSTAGIGQTGILRQYAREHELLISGGSDFHGANKPDVDLGRGWGNLRITHYLYDDIRKKHGKRYDNIS